MFPYMAWHELQVLAQDGNENPETQSPIINDEIFY